MKLSKPEALIVLIEEIASIGSRGLQQFHIP